MGPAPTQAPSVGGKMDPSKLDFSGGGGGQAMGASLSGPEADRAGAADLYRMAAMARGGGGPATPAHWQAEHRTISGMDPRAAQAVIQAQKNEDDATMAVHGVQREELAELTRGKSDAATANADRMQAAFDSRDAEMNEVLANRKRILTDMEAGTVDPKRVWANKSSEEKTNAHIGAFFGGFGGSSYTLDAINKEIDRDVDAQKTQLLQKDKALSGHERIYNDVRTKFGDDAAASDLLKLSRYDALQVQMDRHAAQLNYMDGNGVIT